MTLAKAEERLGIKSLLPQGWRWVRLGDICDMNPSRPAGFRRASDAPTTFVPMSAVDAHRGVIINTEIRPFSEVTKGYTFFSEGDILFAKITPCMQNGKQTIARGLIDGIGFGSTEFHVIRPRPGVASEWIHRFVRQPHVLSSAVNHFTGAVGQQRVPESFLASLEIPLPSIDEQDRIMHIVNEQMTAVEKARAAAESRLESAKALPASYLRHAFPKPGQELPDGWRWTRLGDAFDVKQGVAMSPLRRQGVAPRPFLRTLNVLWGFVDLSNLDKMDFTDDEVANLNLRNGDLLVCEGGDVGRTAIWRGEMDVCLYQNHVHRLRRRNDSIIPDFYLYWMRAAFKVFQSYKGKEVTTTIPNLSGGQLKSFLVPLPPTAEQKHIAYLLSGKMAAVGKTVQTLQQEFETIDALPAALLRRAFTGGL